jgi:hypothetical protein
MARADEYGDEQGDLDDDDEASMEDEDLSEEELDEQIQDMVKEFMSVPEVKSMVTEIAKDAAKRAADAVRNEYSNKLGKSMDARFRTIEAALGLEAGEMAAASGDAESGDEESVAQQRIVKAQVERKKQTDADLELRAAEIEEREKELRRREIEAYKAEVIREQGLDMVANLIHGDDEDAVDESVSGAKKTLSQLRRGFLKEFKDKGWSPPDEEFGGDGTETESASGIPAAQAVGLRKRFNYGGQETPGVQSVNPTGKPA